MSAHFSNCNKSMQMLQRGHWKGQYTFNNPAHNQLRGFERTTFYIEIISTDNNRFAGMVQDDLSTGGTEGIGEISGKRVGDYVEFVKQMPVMTVITDTGTMKDYNRKHSKIYYSGRISADGKSISGSWKFRFKLIWIGLIPYVSSAVGGTWHMMLVE